MLTKCRFRWAWQLLSVLKFLHDKHIVHNALRNTKIFLRTDMSLALHDLGCASSDLVLGRDDGDIRMELEIPLECHFQTLPRTPTADIYAFGGIMFALITRVDPELLDPRQIDDPQYRESNRYMHSVQPEDHQLIPSPEEVVGGAIARKCWNNTYSSIDAVVDDFMEVLTQKGLKVENGEVVFQ